MRSRDWLLSSPLSAKNCRGWPWKWSHTVISLADLSVRGSGFNKIGNVLTCFLVHALFSRSVKARHTLSQIWVATICFLLWLIFLDHTTEGLAWWLLWESMLVELWSSFDGKAVLVQSRLLNHQIRSFLCGILDKVALCCLSFGVCPDRSYILGQ